MIQAVDIATGSSDSPERHHGVQLALALVSALVESSGDDDDDGSVSQAVTATIQATMSDVPLRASVFLSLAEIAGTVLAVMTEQLGLTPDQTHAAWRLIQGAIDDGSSSVEFFRLTRHLDEG